MKEREFYYNGQPTGYIIYPNNEGVYSVKTKKFLNSFCDRNGYVNYALYINGERKQFGYHQLVAETFLVKPGPEYEVDHITGDKTRNSYTDLEWVTRKENVRRSVKMGLKKPLYGESNPSSLYSDELVIRAIDLLCDGCKMSDVSDRLGIPMSFLYGIVSKKNRPDLTRNIEFPNSVYSDGKSRNKRLPKEVVSHIKFLHDILKKTAPEIAKELGFGERQVYQAFYYK